MLHTDINRFFGWPRSNLCSELHNFPFLFGHSTVKRFCPVCRFGPPREAQICSQYDKIWAWRTRGKRNCESSGVAWEVLRADVMRLFSTAVCLHDDNASLLLRPLCAQTTRITDRQLVVMWTILPVNVIRCTCDKMFFTEICENFVTFSPVHLETENNYSRDPSQALTTTWWVWRSWNVLCFLYLSEHPNFPSDCLFWTSVIERYFLRDSSVVEEYVSL